MTRWDYIAAAVAAAGAALQPKATVVAAPLWLALRVFGAQRASAVVLVVLVGAALTGIRIDTTPPATP